MMKVLFAVMTLFFSIAHSQPGDSLTCSTGGFFYNYMSYEETDTKMLFALAGQTLGEAYFNRFEEVSINTWAFSPDIAIYVAFDKNLCVSDANEDIPFINCTKASTQNPVEFFVKRSFKQFDDSWQDVITRLGADEITAEFSKDSGLALIFKNGLYKNRGETDNFQTLTGILAKSCSTIPRPETTIPADLKIEMLKSGAPL